MADFYIKKNDRLASIDAKLVLITGARIDLTNTAVTFRMRKQGSSVDKVNAAASILDPVNGLVRYTWDVSDTGDVGVYNAEFAITYSDGRVRTVPSTGFISVQISDTLAP